MKLYWKWLLLSDGSKQAPRTGRIICETQNKVKMWVHLLRMYLGFQAGGGRALNHAGSLSVGGPLSNGTGPLPAEWALLLSGHGCLQMCADSRIHLHTLQLYLEMLQSGACLPQPSSRLISSCLPYTDTLTHTHRHVHTHTHTHRHAHPQRHRDTQNTQTYTQVHRGGCTHIRARTHALRYGQAGICLPPLLWTLLVFRPLLSLPPSFPDS